MIVTIICAILCSAVSVAAKEVPLSKNKVFITNATPETLVFMLLPTKFPAINRYNERYDDGEVDYRIHELLPGQNIEIYNFVSDVTNYDRVLWAARAEQRSDLENSVALTRKRDKKNVFAIPVGSTKKVFIEKKGHELVFAKDSVRINQVANDYFNVGNAFVKKVCGGNLQKRDVSAKP